MKTAWFKLRVASVASLLLVWPLLGRTTGRIEGRVMEPDSVPLRGVTVTASSLKLRGERIGETDSEGRFQLSPLPPGVYTVVATLDGFNPLEVLAVIPTSRTVESLAILGRQADLVETP